MFKSYKKLHRFLQLPRHFLAASYCTASAGVASSVFDSNRLLSALSKSGRVDDARQVFDGMPCRDEFSWNTIVSAYASSGRLEEARQLFLNAPERTAITWSSLISGYTRHSDEMEALSLFWEMQSQGLMPNQYAWGTVLRICSTSACPLLQRGQQIHAHAIKTHFDSNPFVVTGLVDMYAKRNLVLEAEYLFEMVPNKQNHHVLWTAMLSGYSHNACGFRAMKTFRDMRVEGVQSNHFTFPGILSACAKVSARAFGEQVHGCIVRSGFEANNFVESALVDMYAKCGDLHSARRLLQIMEVDDVVPWNSMIVGCVRQGFNKDALDLFQQMFARNMKLDDFTYPSVLNSLASMSNMERGGESVHCLILKSGFEICQHVSNALVDMYAKHGDLCRALKVFNHMADKDVISWTALVTGHAHNGFYEEAIRLFCEMLTEGIYPDQFVIASVLSASAELTLLEFGQQVHAHLVKSGLGSTISVDNSLVTVYAKSGGIEDATRIFHAMKMRDVITWTALIIAYAQNGKGRDSIQFYDEMVASGIKPDFITFIGLLFACSHAGLVEKGHCYFDSMYEVYGIKPGPEHYACMIDLLGRSGKIKEAKELLCQMEVEVEPDATVWKALLAASKAHGDIELGEMAATELFALEPHNAVPYVMLSNIYSAMGKWEDAARIRKLMKSKGINKEPGCSWMEINCRVHTFMSEDRTHIETPEIYRKVSEMMILIKKAGYVPEVKLSLHDMDEEGKELGLAHHSEKLAVAFGLLNVPPQAPIRIFKNLRVCGDCHTAMKFISVVYCRHIILRDSNCFHHFRERKCSCGDYW